MFCCSPMAARKKSAQWAGPSRHDGTMTTSLAGREGGTLRVAIVGCGNIAHQHARAYAGSGRTELVGLVDIVPERAEAYVDTYGGRTYPDVTSLMSEARPDLVSIVTPPGAHAELAAKVLRAGVSVLIEKPPCPTLAEFDIIAEAERAGGGTAYVVFQHRHGSGARRAAELLGSGALGRPQIAVCETLWFRPDSYFDPDWRGTWSGEGGGPTLGHGIHQIDLLLHLLGPWQHLTAMAVRQARPVEFEDVSLAVVRFENGAVASVVNSLLSPRELSRIRIDTTAGTLELNHVYGYSDADWSFVPVPRASEAASLGKDPGTRDATGALRDSTAEVSDGANDAWAASAGMDVPSNHAAQITRLVDDLHAGRTHQTTLASTRSTVEFVSGVYASALLGREILREDLVAGHPFYVDLSGGMAADDITARMT
ncbi:MAG: gfo/Idh/MocA family oxidoreductase [Propionibacteriaceae bacterium]|nr:gfo/Idh/MocA family oxidoreductase [Propionibacteriaceae bacterium]